MKVAAVALRRGQAVLPAHRSKFSKRQFTPPQWLAVLCLMRDEEWTFREAEGRLAGHRELRAALGLRGVPDAPTLDRFLRRLDEAVLEPVLRAAAQGLLSPPGGQATVASDATGLTPGAIRTCFVKRAKDREPGFTWRHWLQGTMALGVDRRVILAPTARRGPTTDGALWRPLVDIAHQHGPIGLVLADAECDRERHHQHGRHVVQAQSVMPATRGGAKWHIRGRRAQMRQAVPGHLYRRRSRIESVISALKRTLSARAPGRSLDMRCLQALRLGIAYNIDRLRFLAWPQVLRMSTEPRSL